MKRSIFGLHQLDEIVGAVVLACIGVFIAVLINAGLLKDWFQPSFTLRILLPDDFVGFPMRRDYETDYDYITVKQLVHESD